MIIKKEEIMNEQHVLIKFSTKKPYANIPDMPNGAVYSLEKGYWMQNGEPLVSYNSEYGINATKKCDIETGEDQKGE